MKVIKVFVTMHDDGKPYSSIDIEIPGVGTLEMRETLPVEAVKEIMAIAERYVQPKNHLALTKEVRYV